MQIVCSYNENYFYYFLSNFQSPDFAADFARQNEVKAQQFTTLKSSVEHYMSVLLKYPWCSESQEFLELQTNLYSYLTNVGVAQMDGSGLVDFCCELQEILDGQKADFNFHWQSIAAASMVDYFEKQYVPYIVQAIHVFKILTASDVAKDIVVHLLEALPPNKGQYIANNEGFHVAVGFAPAEFRIEYLRSIISQLAHFFSDGVHSSFIEMDAEVLEPAEDYLQKEACAEYLTLIFFKYCLLDYSGSVSNLPELFNIHVRLGLNILDRGISIYHLGAFSRGVKPEIGDQYGVMKDIFFICATEQETIFFSSYLGRLYKVPLHFFSSLDPLQINLVYEKHFSKSMFIVPDDFEMELIVTEVNEEAQTVVPELIMDMFFEEDIIDRRVGESRVCRVRLEDTQSFIKLVAGDRSTEGIVSRNIACLISKGIRVQTLVTISQGNNLVMIYEYLKKMGVTSMKFNPQFEMTEEQQEPSSQLRLLEFARIFMNILRQAEKDEIEVTSDFFGELLLDYRPQNICAEKCVLRYRCKIEEPLACAIGSPSNCDNPTCEAKKYFALEYLKFKAEKM